MKRKLLLFTVIILFMFTSVGQNVYAYSDMKGTEYQTRFSNITKYDNVFYISKNGEATLTSVILARNVDEIKINLYLQRYSDGAWRTVKSWLQKGSGTSIAMEEEHYVTSGYAYRMVSYAYVYEGGMLSETTSYTSELEFY